MIQICALLYLLHVPPNMSLEVAGYNNCCIYGFIRLRESLVNRPDINNNQTSANWHNPHWKGLFFAYYIVTFVLWALYLTTSSSAYPERTPSPGFTSGPGELQGPSSPAMTHLINIYIIKIKSNQLLLQGYTSGGSGWLCVLCLVGPDLPTLSGESP